MNISDYAEVIRTKFLVLSVLIAFTGTSIAVYEGVFNFFHSVLGFLVLVLLHISVNSLNVARDFKSGIDKETEKTPFSGGVNTLVSGSLGYKPVLYLGLISMVLSLPVFTYFALAFDPVIVSVIFLTAFTLVIGYTDFFARYMLGEVSAGIGLGSLSVFSIYYFQSGSFSPTSILVSAGMFVPTFNLLILNEFPDMEIDKRHGRKNIPIVFGRENAVRIFRFTNLSLASIIIFYFLKDFVPVFTLSAAVPSLLSLKLAGKISENSYNVEVQDMKLNTVLTHSVFLLTGLSLVLSSLL